MVQTRFNFANFSKYSEKLRTENIQTPSKQKNMNYLRRCLAITQKIILRKMFAIS